MNVCNGIFALILVFLHSYDESCHYRRTSLVSTVESNVQLLCCYPLWGLGEGIMRAGCIQEGIK